MTEIKVRVSIGKYRYIFLFDGEGLKIFDEKDPAIMSFVGYENLGISDGSAAEDPMFAFDYSSQLRLLIRDKSVKLEVVEDV